MNNTNHFLNALILSIQVSRSVVSDSLRPHELQHARPPCPSPIPGSLLKPMSIESVMSSNHLILCRPLLLLPSILPSIRVCSNESVLRIHQVAKVLEFQLQHQSFHGEGNGNPLQYSCLENPMDGGDW